MVYKRARRGEALPGGPGGPGAVAAPDGFNKISALDGFAPGSG
ncbi:hypothetical protein GCM10023321_71310 [Pseudonocardia eucalypti]|uniref:Uncharacterized protein n=1 Tax=Pseudonocardia eucalypti TaxID=648755 RepID=A0ABP9R5L4_9PSEU